MMMNRNDGYGSVSAAGLAKIATSARISEMDVWVLDGCKQSDLQSLGCCQGTSLKLP